VTKNNLVAGIDVSALSKRIAYFNDGHNCLERLKTNCYRLSDSMRFTSHEFHRNNKTILEISLMDVYEYLSDLVEFKNKYFPLINHVMKINLCYENYHNEVQNWSHEPFKTLKDLRKRPLYEEVISLVCRNTYEDARGAYMCLYEEAKRKGIIKEGSELAVKLEELNNKVTQF
jgi:hypothetical protein